MKYTDRKFVLTNTMSGKRELFAPMEAPRVKFYSCGPTVYGPLHIGNARALLFADTLYRWLSHIGYDVNFVRNYTDVDDKIIDRAKKEGVDSLVISERYIEYCETDIRLLGLKSPTKTCKVTETMPEIIALIQKIIDRGHAYVVEGEVLFSIDSFPGYGKLSGKNVEDLVAGARVEVSQKKRNPLDFSLWKPHKAGEPHWPSPWGEGRPGWHIECSAMVARWLGDTIDLHHGGQDLMFPHHENEIAQSEAGTGKPFCGHWVHHAFLTSGNEKMSKSLGNILTIRDFIEKYGAEVLRYLYLSFHFRSAVPYTEETMNQVLGELERLYSAKQWAERAAKGAVSPGSSSSAWSGLEGKAAEVFRLMEEELFADLNTSGALGHLFSHVRALNRAESEAAGKPGTSAPATEGRAKVAREFLSLLDDSLKPLLNFAGETPEAMLQKIEQVRASRHGGSVSDEEIQRLIVERATARKDRNFARADQIRVELDQKGILLVDSPQGTTWKFK